MRVNARIDATTQAQIDELAQATGHSVSQVLRESIAHDHAQVRQQQPVPSKLLALVGQGRSGRSDGASDVKRQVANAVLAKHGAGKPPSPSLGKVPR